MLPPGGNWVANPWHILEKDDHMLPQTKYKLKPYRGCKLVSRTEWVCTMLYLQHLAAALKRGNRDPMLYDQEVNVLQFCALHISFVQFTFTSLDRKSKLKSPRKDDYKEFGAWYWISRVFVLVQREKIKIQKTKKGCIFCKCNHTDFSRGAGTGKLHSELPLLTVLYNMICINQQLR